MCVFKSICKAFEAFALIPALIVVGMAVMWSIAPLAIVIVPMFVLFNIIGSFFGLSFINY